MKNFNKIASVVLAIVMLLSMVSGCAKEPAQNASDPTATHDHTEAEPTVEPTSAPEPTDPSDTEEIEYASVVFVSVNPRFAIYFDAEGKVVKATAENDDGTALEADMEALMGMTAANAVEVLLDTIAEAGYFADGEHDIVLTFYGEEDGEVEDIAKLGALEKAIYEAAKAYVTQKNINTTVKVKKSPAAAAVKLADLDKLPSPPAPKDPEKEADKENPKDKDPKPTKPTEPKPTTPPTKPTEPSHKHNYKSETVKATCTATGYTKYTCDCGDTYTDKETAKLGHDYKTEVVKATYEAGGYTKYTCKRCGHYYEDNRTAPLPKPTEPTEGPSGEETQPTEPVDPDAKCPYCGGPHYLYECPKAKEDAEEEPEAIVCGYCGSTNCEYPKTGDKTKCPSYDEKKDATKYCQHCGESTSICHRWTAEVTCPNCGALVPARTCHYC